MNEVWPPPPTNQPKHLPPQVSERAGVVALLFTVVGMLLVVVNSQSHMHLIAAVNRNPKVVGVLDGLGVLGVLLLVLGGVLGIRSRHTKYGLNAVIMSFFMLLGVGFVVLVLLLEGQL